jgi:hypothetical protein
VGQCPASGCSPRPDLSTSGERGNASIDQARRRILSLVVTLADIRPWGDDDDPSEYSTLLTDWPHAEERCPACSAVYPWFFTARLSAIADGNRKLSGIKRAARAAFNSAYPKRYRGVEEHRRQVRRASREAPAAAKRVRIEAARFLAVGLTAARKEGLIPSVPRPGSRHPYDGPWPYQWSCQEIAQSEPAEPLLAALREAYPARFGEASASPYQQPHRYMAALLRSVIAESIVERRRPSGHSPIARSAIDELLRTVSKETDLLQPLVDRRSRPRRDQSTIGRRPDFLRDPSVPV